MKSFADKLGIRDGHLVAVIDPGSDLFRKLTLELPTGASIQKRITGEKVDVIIIRLVEKTDYRRLFMRLQAAIKPDGAIWAVIPKKATALEKGIDVFRNDMVGEALGTDLVDNKTLSFGDEEYGTRFVIRRERRNKKPNL